MKNLYNIDNTNSNALIYFNELILLFVTRLSVVELFNVTKLEQMLQYTTIYMPLLKWLVYEYNWNVNIRIIKCWYFKYIRMISIHT